MKIRIFKNTESDTSISMRLYADNLIGRLKELPDFEIEPVSIKGRKFPFFKDFFSKDIFYPIYAKFKEGYINHILDHSYGGLAYLLDPKRTVVTCHDLNPLEFKAQSSWLGRRRFIYNLKGMLKARYLITVSESTRRVLLKHFDYEGIIHTIYSGVDERFKRIEDIEQKNATKRKLGLDEKAINFLHVGSSKPVKNTELILKTMAKIPDCNLIKVGAFTSTQEHLIRNLKIENRIVRFKEIDITGLSNIYNISDLFVFPSFCEGFGFPVLEALSCGCPVICSGTSSLPEVGGDAPLYINPYSESELESAIDKVLSDEELRDAMVEKGLRQAKRFSWEKTVEETISVYRKIAGNL